MSDITCKVVKRCRNIFCRVSIGGVADDQTGLAHGSVSDQDAVHLALRRRAGPPAPHADREVPTLEAAWRDLRTITSAKRVRHTAGFLIPDVSGQHGSGWWCKGISS